MSYKWFWICFASLAFLMCVVLSLPFYSDYEVYTYGKVCKVVIKSLPTGDQMNDDVMYFYKDDHLFDKKVEPSFALLHQPGDTIEMKYLDDFNGHFLFKDENPMYWGIFTMGLIVSSGIACLYYAFKKDPPVVRFPWQKK